MPEHSLTLQAGKAFGSGAHPSTALALSLLARLAEEREFRRVLDIGCGAGLLALAAAKLTEAHVTAADIAEEAVETTRRNAAENGLAERIRAGRADGYDHPAIAANGPYDLILCNVLADHAVRWARDLAAHLAPDGRAILSGILAWQMEQVVEAHACVGLVPETVAEDGDWRAAALRHG